MAAGFGLKTNVLFSGIFFGSALSASSAELTSSGAVFFAMHLESATAETEDGAFGPALEEDLPTCTSSSDVNSTPCDDLSSCFLFLASEPERTISSCSSGSSSSQSFSCVSCDLRNTHTHTHTRAYTHTHTSAHTHTSTRAHTHTRTHNHTQRHTHTHAHTHTHIHTRTPAPEGSPPTKFNRRST